MNSNISFDSVIGKRINLTSFFKDENFVKDMIDKVLNYTSQPGSGADIEFYNKITKEQIVLVPAMCDYIIKIGKFPEYDDIKNYILGPDVEIYTNHDGSIMRDEEIRQIIIMTRPNNFYVGLLREIYTAYQIYQLYPDYICIKFYKNDIFTGQDISVYNSKLLYNSYLGGLSISVKHDGYSSNQHTDRKDKRDKSDIRLVVPHDTSNEGLHVFSVKEIRYKLEKEYNIHNKIKDKHNVHNVTEQID